MHSSSPSKSDYRSGLKLGLIAGFLIALIIASAYFFVFNSSENNADSGEKTPLYWVAPMDPNFRRDGPGLSPMGMALVPVYEESGANDEPGTVRIKPHIIQNLGVKSAYAKTLSLPRQISTVGYIKYNENKLIHVHPRVEGWIEKLYVKTEGVAVEKGDPLYELYSPELVNAQEELLLAYQQNNRTLIHAAQSRLLSLKMPKSNLNTLKKTRKIQRSVTFYAQTSGVLDMLNVREGVFVKPGTAMMTLASLEDIWVEGEVFEQNAHHVEVGQPLTLTLNAQPEKLWQGQVEFIYPAMDANMRTLRFRASFPNIDHQLHPNMFTQLQLETTAAQARLVVPKNAVIRTAQQDRVVLAKGNGVFKSVAVKLGNVTRDYAEILSGLLPGDAVVVAAQFLIDSESSINSDFLRISPPPQSTDLSAPIQSAEVDGEIVSVDKQARRAEIHRGPIEKWGRDADTVLFEFADDVDISDLAQGVAIRFIFEIRDGDFVIVSFDKKGGN